MPKSPKAEQIQPITICLGTSLCNVLAKIGSSSSRPTVKETPGGEELWSSGLVGAGKPNGRTQTEKNLPEKMAAQALEIYTDLQVQAGAYWRAWANAYWRVWDGGRRTRVGAPLDPDGQAWAGGRVVVGDLSDASRGSDGSPRIQSSAAPPEKIHPPMETQRGREGCRTGGADRRRASEKMRPDGRDG